MTNYACNQCGHPFQEYFHGKINPETGPATHFTRSRALLARHMGRANNQVTLDEFVDQSGDQKGGMKYCEMCGNEILKNQREEVRQFLKETTNLQVSLP